LLNILEEERRSQIALRRMARFFGNRLPGIESLYERFERLGDPLVEFNDIVNWLEVAGLSREAVIQRFRSSVKFGALGWRHYGRRRAVVRLLDLASFSRFPCGQYLLRPSVLTVEMQPLQMRMPRTVCVAWLRAQGWPVPSELESSVITDHVPTAPAAMPKPERVSRPKPDQAVVNAWLLAWSDRNQGRKIKQGDRDLFHACKAATGARETQFRAACRNLPERYRHTRGRPQKSCK
jgi:hypothetical protein